MKGIRGLWNWVKDHTLDVLWHALGGREFDATAVNYYSYCIFVHGS